MTSLTVSDFGNPIVNGSYSSDGTKDGQTRYVKSDNSNVIIEYREEFGPYCFSEAYYIILVNEGARSMLIEEPLYKIDSDDPTGLTWITMQGQSLGSNYNSVGTVS